MKLLEAFLIRHCSPTLAALKTASLFNCSYSTEKELIEKAAACDIRVYGMSDYIVGEPGREAVILLGYANMPEGQIREACGILCGIWKK